MRHTWRSGYRTAEAVAAELHTTIRKLAELRRLPLREIPAPTPSNGSKTRNGPAFPFTFGAVDQGFATLIGQVELMALRYEQQARNSAQWLAELDKSGTFVAPAELRGCMHDGYTPKKVNAVPGQLSDLSGLRIVCVWDCYDSDGYCGSSDFFIEREADATLHCLAGNLWAWLRSRPDDPAAPETPGHPASSVDAMDTEITTTELGGDGLHHYATEVR